MRLFKKKPKDDFTRKELQRIYSHLPEFIVNFVHDTFFLAAVTTLSWWGTDNFDKLMKEHIEFLKTADAMSVKEEKPEDDVKLSDSLLTKFTKTGGLPN